MRKLLRASARIWTAAASRRNKNFLATMYTNSNFSPPLPLPLPRLALFFFCEFATAVYRALKTTETKSQRKISASDTTQPIQIRFSVNPRTLDGGASAPPPMTGDRTRHPASCPRVGSKLPSIYADVRHSVDSSHSLGPDECNDKKPTQKPTTRDPWGGTSGPAEMVLDVEAYYCGCGPERVIIKGCRFCEMCVTVHPALFPPSPPSIHPSSLSCIFFCFSRIIIPERVLAR